MISPWAVLELKRIRKRTEFSVLFFCLLILISGIGIRAAHIFHEPDLQSDEAVFGLMAKHIGEGTEFPQYFWKRPNAGALISYTAVPAFSVFGPSGKAFKFSLLIFFFLPSLVCVYFLAKEIFGDTVIPPLALTFFALAPPFVAVHSISPLGIYSEMLLFAPLILLFAFRAAKRPSIMLSVLSGFLWGISLWTGFLLLPFVIFAIVVMYRARFFSHRSRIIVVGLSFVAGSLPAIIYSSQHPGENMIVLAGRLLELPRSVLSSHDCAQLLATQVMKRTLLWIKTVFMSPLLLLKVAVPGKPEFLAWLVFPLYIWGFAAAWARRGEDRRIRALLVLCAVSMVIYSLPGMGEPRHFLALFVPMIIFLAFAIEKLSARSKLLSLCAAAVVVAVNIAANGAQLKKKTPSYSRAAAFLAEQGLSYGYGDFWAAYSLTFASREKIIISPTLRSPSFFEQYPAYTAAVNRQENIFYVCWHEEPGIIERKLDELKITYSKEDVDSFSIYYGFSRRIAPAELDYLSPLDK